MSSFPQNIFAIFGRLQTNYRFVAARAFAGNRFASMVRHEARDVFVYVFVHDGRPSDSNLDVDVWVAPPDSPDHSLDKLYVGYRIHIAGEYDVDDAFFVKCEERIIHFLPCVSAMVPLVREELLKPSIWTKRWVAYHIERKALSNVLLAADAGDADAIAAVTASKRLAKRNGDIEKLEDVCMAIATSLIERSVEDDVGQLFRDNVKSLASTLATHLYVKALGELSASLGVKG